MPSEKTFSELLFEEYLVSQGISTFDYEKDWEGIPTHPDYTVYHNGNTFIFDVKEFDYHPLHPGQIVFDNPCDRIREKINKVRTQFKHFKDKPCCLVLYTHDPLVELHEWTTMLGAMYGDFGVTMLFAPEKGSAVPDSTRHAFLTGGKMFRYESSKPQNQTVSALVTLRHVYVGQRRYRKLFRDSLKTGEQISTSDVDFDIDEKLVSVIVWENAFARIPFPREMFAGFYDERWGIDGDVITRIFAGKGIIALEELDESEA